MATATWKQKIIKLPPSVKKKYRRQIEYIRRREQKHIKTSKLTDKEIQKELEKLYKRRADDLEREILANYTRYAGKEGLTVDEAYRKASKMDVERFARKAEEYVKNKDFSDEANEQLRAYNLKMRVNRLELLKRDAELELMRLHKEETETIEKHLNDEAVKEIKRQAGILSLKDETRETLIKNADKIVNDSFHGAPFSKRLWADKRVLTSRVQAGIERSILQGRNPREFARSLTPLVTKEMRMSKAGALYAAERLAITETARVQEEIALESIEEGGYKHYTWIADVDERTCPICSTLDGEIIKVEDGEVGVTTPPIHPWCRCAIAAIII